ncbi:MAG: DUF294 nucleotidyltransferase-like domain-containing protein [Rhizobiaceae bacterium]
MANVTGATPLAALPAVAVDSETTGLDTQTARVVQFGVRRIAGGALDPDAAFDRLVDPGIAIPPIATRIHGITDAMVRGRPAFATVWPEYLAFVGDRIVIGHSIGFDLAVFEREARRAGLAFQRPRSLCVRLLATVANPRLPDYSLETIASWLGIELAGRHSALGDATSAAVIFNALLPKLAGRGVRTLAEAERASLSLAGELADQHRAGWTEPVSKPALPAFGAIDPYAYRHRIGDVMSAPPVVVAETLTAAEAIALMVERRISALFVAADGAPGRAIGDYGIVTERDMMRRIASEGASALGHPVGHFATRPVVSVRTAAFAYRAIGRMDRLKIRHLAVRDDNGRIAGIVSARDLLKLRASAAIRLDDAIEDAGNPTEMAAAWSTLPAVARGLIGEGVDARVVAEVVSEELCALTRRAGILAEAAMAAEGQGAPPCPYALLVLGSGGRGESLLAADQDNAIVFARGEPDGPEDRWFAALGTRIADALDAAGVPYCKGGVMAKNPPFRGSLDLWKERIADWIVRSRPEDLLNVDIVYDFRPVHGDLELAADLFAHAYAAGSENPGFAKLLGEQLGSLGNPFGLFGGLSVQMGRIDLKLHGLFPIVATARTLAIRHGIAERATKARLEALIARNIGGDADMAVMIDGHAFLVRLMLAQQSADLLAGIPVSNKVEVAKLSREDQARLKVVLKQLQSAPALVRDLMFG